MRSPDAPVAQREDDLLRRWNLAKTIYDLVRACPREWSPRVGLYGGWGEGKTSVLKFIESLALAEGVPVLWFSPWNVQDRIELWTAFSTELERRLGYRPGRKRRARRWINDQWRRVSPWLRAAASVPAGALPAELPPHSAEVVKGIFTVTETLLPSLAKDTPARRDQVEHQLLAIPVDARLIVVIDDIDRGNAELMPHLLLALREVFDLPGCAFIAAFDPRTVADALPAAHPGWKPTPEFLEKIIQFPFWLPTPTREDVLRLAQEEVKAFPGAVVDAAALREVADLLPTNPRRLKDFFRGLWRLSPTLARHDASELKWMPLLLIELMRALSPAATQALFQDEKFREDLGVATFFPPDSKSEPGTKVIKELHDYAMKILTDATCPEDVRADILRLVDAFRERVSSVGETSIAYWAHLDASRAPILTWKEFNALVAAWRPNPSAARLAELVEARAKAVGCVVEAAYRELFETAVAYRGAAISRAADVILDQQIDMEMDQADVGLALLGMVVRDQKGFARQPSILTGAHFRQLMEQFGHWAHFRNHARYIAAREAERELLLEAARDGATFASETIESMRPWSGLFGAFSPERTQLKEMVVQTLCTHVFDDLLTRFSRKDGIAALWGKDRHLTEKHFLYRRDGGFYTDARIARLKEVIEEAKTSMVVQENLYEYVRLLGYGLRGNSETLTIDELKPLAGDVEIVLPVWRGATAQPLQPRVVGELRGTRVVLGKQLPEGQVLQLPPWWPPDPPPALGAEGVPLAPEPAE